ncbi:hypothetical protein UCDDS831_g04180 [Diplodia seriata]|uniref:Uncharacterized protein n=1 Tax=Diplodia seriata TaxID=420778 RepID=A0A0G2GYE0_9PEZI|nr:hypothetical protein UCDDS831_g04180 [Diplodia seriata]
MRSLPELLFGVGDMDFLKIVLAVLFSVSFGIVLFTSRMENSGRRAHDKSNNHSPASGPSTARLRRGSTVAADAVPVIGSRDYRLQHAMDEQVREQVTRAAAHATAVAHDEDCECCALENKYEL